jgi:mannose-1-phosphate guanylyltransferase
MTQHTHVVIMAGGAGTRFWPASTEEKPKQFLDILGTGKSLLRLTFERFLPLTDVGRIHIVTNRKYVPLVREQLPELDVDQILGEPSRNNTAPCIAYAVLKIHDRDPRANIVVAPSDHLILREDAFLRVIREGLAFTAGQEAICTLGIRPSRPDTGYGYIHFGEAVQGNIHPVKSFKEKPAQATAETYLASGEYLWNAGIFLFSSATILHALDRYEPGIGACLRPIPWNGPGEEAALDLHYPRTPEISIDYAVMERADNVFTLPCDIGWSDLGTWASLYAELPRDDSGNAVQATRSRLREASGNLVRCQPGKSVLIRGIDNMIVVDEPEALLIYPLAKEQEVKKEVQEGW